MSVLLIRSASLERFDCFMEKFTAQPEAGGVIDVLTHIHSAASLRAAYPGERRINVIEYPFRGGFGKRNVLFLVRKKKLKSRYKKVIVLTGNVSGAGHHNVLNAAFTISRDISLFNTESKFVNVAPGKFRREKFWRILLFPVVISATLVLSIWGCLLLLAGFAVKWSFRFCRRKETGYGEKTG